MVRIWRLFQAGHLPDAGGVMDQPVVMMQAFVAMSAKDSELRVKR